MKKSKFFTAVALLLLFTFWIYCLFQVPTFDLDESLYRRVAEEMKASGDFWHATWDGKPFHHKPPFFYWIIVFFSYVFDGTKTGISVFAARLPSLLSTIGILFSIAVFHRRTAEPLSTSLIHTTLTWACTLFPVVTSIAVIFDPLQTLALMPALLIPHRAFTEGRSLRHRELNFIAISMFAATAIKGLTGLILPTLAIGLHTVIREWNMKRILKAAGKYLIHAFFPALFLSGVLFWFLDYKIGHSFTEEFFLVHHFGRGTSAMEAHHGSIFYYPLVAIFGGGLLIPLLVYYFSRVKFDYRRFGFALSYCIAVIGFFSISATKLPHYSWPIWPALTLQFLVLIRLPGQQGPDHQRIVWNVFSLPLVLIGGGIFYLVLGSVEFTNVVIDDLSLFLLSAGATICVFFPMVFKKFTKQPEYVAFFMVLITMLIAIPAAKIGESVLVTPFSEAVKELKKHHPLPSQKLRYAGPMSATLSLILAREIGQGYVHNRSEPTDYRYLMVVPEKKHECLNSQHETLLQTGNLILCRKK